MSDFVDVNNPSPPLGASQNTRVHLREARDSARDCVRNDGGDDIATASSQGNPSATGKLLNN